MEGFRVFYIMRDSSEAMFEIDITKTALIHILDDGMKKLLSANSIPYKQHKLILPYENILDGRAIEINEADLLRLLDLLRKV